MIDVTGALVRLRPLLEDELDRLVEARADDQFQHLAPGKSPREILRTRIERSGRFVKDRLDLAIEAGGRLVGEIEARHPQPSPPGVFELGIMLFGGERGRGFGLDAVTVLTGVLFESQNAARVQASTAVENAAMRRVLEKAGFQFEGVMRGFMPTAAGDYEDYALYALTRADWDGRARGAAL